MVTIAKNCMMMVMVSMARMMVVMTLMAMMVMMMMMMMAIVATIVCRGAVHLCSSAFCQCRDFLVMLRSERVCGGIFASIDC